MFPTNYWNSWFLNPWYIDPHGKQLPSVLFTASWIVLVDWSLLSSCVSWTAVFWARSYLEESSMYLYASYPCSSILYHRRMMERQFSFVVQTTTITQAPVAHRGSNSNSCAYKFEFCDLCAVNSHRVSTVNRTVNSRVSKIWLIDLCKQKMKQT